MITTTSKMFGGGILLLGRRRTFEAFLLFMCIGAGTSGVLGGTDTVTSFFPRWAQIVWFGGLLIGGMLGLVGVIVWNVTGVLIERVGLGMLSLLCLGYTIYSVALCMLHDGISAYSTTLVFLFCLICQHRVWQIPRDLEDYNEVQLERQELRALRSAINNVTPD